MKTRRFWFPLFPCGPSCWPRQGRREEASSLASEVLERGLGLVHALLESERTVTPLELAWLFRDLGREDELLSALDSRPGYSLGRGRARDRAGRLRLERRDRRPDQGSFGGGLHASAHGAGAGAGRAPCGGRQVLRPVLLFFSNVGARRYFGPGGGPPRGGSLTRSVGPRGRARELHIRAQVGWVPRARPPRVRVRCGRGWDMTARTPELAPLRRVGRLRALGRDSGRRAR
jgi:hypothetical protein